MQVSARLETRTCVDRLAMGGQTDSQVDASSTQIAKKPFQCSLARAPVLEKTILKPTCVNLLWVTKRAKTALTCVKIGAGSRRTQVIASHCKYFITCNSVWPGLFDEGKMGNSICLNFALEK